MPTTLPCGDVPVVRVAARERVAARAADGLPVLRQGDVMRVRRRAARQEERQLGRGRDVPERAARVGVGLDRVERQVPLNVRVRLVPDAAGCLRSRSRHRDRRRDRRDNDRSEDYKSPNEALHRLTPDGRVKRPKTATAATRDVPLDDVLAGELRRHRLAMLATRGTPTQVFASTHRHRASRPQPARAVVPARCWNGSAGPSRDYGLPTRSARSYVSALIATGLDVANVSKYAGHALTDDHAGQVREGVRRSRS